LRKRNILIERLVGAVNDSEEEYYKQTPERMLACAIVFQAVDDYIYGHGFKIYSSNVKTKDKLDRRADAKRFLFNDNSMRPFGFHWLCAHISPEGLALVKMLREFLLDIETRWNLDERRTCPYRPRNTMSRNLRGINTQGLEPIG